MPVKKPLLVLAGPTATGKSRLALEIAGRLDAELISADSAQVYRGMDIGTAKPTPAERERVPHHLLDIVPPDAGFTAADYQSLAQEAIAGIRRRNKLPVMVGGTGLYIKAVVDDYAFSPAGEDRQLRQVLNERARDKGVEHLYRELEQLDPETAARTIPGNLRRIIRALEYYYSTGEPISAQYHRTRCRAGPYDAVMVCLTRPRPVLYRRIEQRVDQMIASGLVEEVKKLLEQGFSRDLKSMQAIGYRQVAAYLEGEVTLEQAVESIKRDTRRYAKRQLTWFRGDSRYLWIDLDQGEKQAVDKIISLAAGKSV